MILRPYQAHGVRFLRDRLVAFLGDEMGLGKTGQYTTAAVEVGAQTVLIVAPASTLPGLAKEVQKWGAPAPVVLDQSGKVKIAGPGWYLIAWTSLAARREELFATEWDLVILDEAHRAKNPSAKMTKVALGRLLRRKDGTIARTRCLRTQAKRFWAASGTPIQNRPIDLQQILYLGFNFPWAERDAYGTAYCLRKNRMDPLGYDYDGARNLEALAARLRESDIFLRRTAEDVPGELPDLSVEVVPLAAPDAKCPLEKQAIRAALGRGRPPPFEAGATYRREAGKAKAGACAKWIRDFAADGEPAVVFGWHPEVVAEVCMRAGMGGAVITGDTPIPARAAAVEAFAEGREQLFYGTIGACGVGINGLHRRANVAIFCESSWVPADMSQAIGRVRRLGGTGRPTRAIILCAEDSLDAYIMGTVASKIETARTVLAEVEGDLSWLE